MVRARIGTPRSWSAALVFFAFTTPFGIATHLISELAGLGWHDDAELVFSARHGYLALLALLALGAFVRAFAGLSPAARRKRVAEIVASLPCGGRGSAFFVLSFGAQFAFFAVTQVGEGSPLARGDVATGVFAAAIAALCGALTVDLGKRRVLELALALFWFVPRCGARERTLRGVRREPRRALSLPQLVLAACGSRPPPIRT